MGRKRRGRGGTPTAQAVKVADRELDKLLQEIIEKYAALKEKQLGPEEKKAFKVLYKAQNKADLEVYDQVSVVHSVLEKLNEMIFTTASQLAADECKGAMKDAFQALKRTAFEWIKKHMRLSSIAQMGWKLDTDYSLIVRSGKRSTALAP